MQAKKRNQITDTLIDYYRSNKTSAINKEQILDCLATVWDGYHPDNWVADVAECEGQGVYNYTEASLKWMYDIGVIN